MVLNQLYRFTALQTIFGVNMVALNGGRPESLNLKDLSRPSSTSARKWSRRRTKYLLTKARERAHILVGLAIAVANIDEVIRAHPHRRRMPTAAREALMGRALAGPRHGAADRA